VEGTGEMTEEAYSPDLRSRPTFQRWSRLGDVNGRSICAGGDRVTRRDATPGAVPVRADNSSCYLRRPDLAAGHRSHPPLPWQPNDQRRPAHAPGPATLPPPPLLLLLLMLTKTAMATLTSRK